MQENLNYYQLLRVPKDASFDEIKMAFRKLARQYHPDLNPDDPAAKERFQELSKAYEILCDPERRRKYDRLVETTGTKKNTTSAQDFYLKGVKKALDRDYRGAMENYNKAIEIEPRFLEAYIKRCELRYKLGDDRGVLEDCYQILQLNSKSTVGCYYQGRSRQRLGYLESALEAYSNTLECDRDYAPAYYYRGLTYQELKQYEKAIQDFNIASTIFLRKNNLNSYKLAQASLKELDRKLLGSNVVSFLAGDLLVYAWQGFKLFALNPAGGIVKAYQLFNTQLALGSGMLYGLFSYLIFIASILLIKNELLYPFFYKLIIASGVPFISLTIAIAITRLICQGSGSLAGDFLISGSSMLMVSFFAFLSSLVYTFLNSPILLLFLGLFALCYLILMLYSGCNYLSNLSESTSALIVPVILLITGWFSYFAFVFLFINERL